MISVTTVLQPWTDFSMIKPEVLNAACERGTEIHGDCGAYALGNWYPLPKAYSGYRKSFRSWFDNMVEKVIGVEMELVSKIFGFLGHPDIICELKDGSGVIIVDYKTPISLQKTWRLQLAGYKILAEEVLGITVDRLACLRLKKDGGYPIFSETPSDEIAIDMSAFLNALGIYKYMKGDKECR